MPRKPRKTTKPKPSFNKRISLILHQLADPRARKRLIMRQFQRFTLKNIINYWKNLKHIRNLFIGLLVLVAAFVVFSIFVVINLQKDLPAIRSLYGKNLGGSVSYYDRTGKTLLWTDYNAVDRIPVSGSSMSPYIRNATVAIEDKYFYKEGAIDFGGILRSAAHDILNPNGQLEGGSTITQQFVKLNENWIGHVTIWRKIKEVYLAYDVSRSYSKAEILTGYLNIVPYGGPDYGIEAAAQDYFHTTPAKLTLAQASMLAAIPQSPAYYSPRSPTFSKQALIARQDYILSLMLQQGYINKTEEETALKTNVLAEVQPPQGLYSHIIAPYFDLAAKQQFENQFGSSLINQGGVKVITTLNLPQQYEAQKLVAADLPAIQQDGGNEAATVVENAPTGQVTALVGGVNFNNPNYGQINYANIEINPGSTYKLYDYTALINDNSNVGSGSVLFDSKGPLPGYPCTNSALPSNGGNCLYDYDYQYPGPLPLEYALAGSRNVPAVKAALINGESKTIALSEAMGLKSGYNCYANSARTIKTTCYGSAAIGEGGYLQLDQSVNGFATDARLGNYVPQTFILQIDTASGKVAYQWHQPAVDQVVKPDAAYIVDSMLDDPGASYLPGSCSAYNCTPMSSFGFKFQRTNGWDVAIKTGTTHNDNTGLMMGMTTQYVVGSWVGYYTANQPLIPHYGGLEGLTEPLTRGMITYLTQGQKPQNWVAPPGIKILPAYVINHPPAQVLGHYYGWQYPSPAQGLYPSWYNGKVTANTPTCNVYAFSIDTLYKGGIPPGVPDCSQTYVKPHTTPAVTQQALAVAINNVSCSSASSGGTCQLSVTATKGSAALSNGSSPSGGDGTIQIISNGQVLQSVAIPATNAGSYLTTITTVSLPAGSVITAKVIDSAGNSAVSQPVTLVGASSPAPPSGNPPGNGNGN